MNLGLNGKAAGVDEAEIGIQGRLGGRDEARGLAEGFADAAPEGVVDVEGSGTFQVDYCYQAALSADGEAEFPGDGWIEGIVEWVMGDVGREEGSAGTENLADDSCAVGGVVAFLAVREDGGEDPVVVGGRVFGTPLGVARGEDRLETGEGRAAGFWGEGHGWALFDHGWALGCAAKERKTSQTSSNTFKCLRATSF